jgi:[acyl-carrier-protein] S-malonyltransferase
MRRASDGLRDALAAAAVRAASIPVIANVNAEPHRDPATIRDWLVQQLVEPVQWQSTIEGLIRSGCDRFVEIGPGKVLSGLMRRIDRNVCAVSVNGAAALQQLKESV